MAGADGAGTAPPVALVAVDEAVLERLVAAATTDAAADEVTPRLTADDGAWSAARVAWLRALHRDRRGGLDGPAGEATWAVVAAGEVAGSVRLRRTDDTGCYETGIWLRRSVRGRGVGQAAVAAVVREAAARGATAVTAETSATNAAALRALSGLGFTTAPAAADGRVRAVLPLTAPAPPRLAADGPSPGQ